MELFYSFIIPVYNRPEEVADLLQSFSDLKTDEINYEILIIEDGSTRTSESLFEQYSEKLPLHYFYKKNSGPGDSRNYGMKRAKGNYFIILDSDVLLPADYLLNVHTFLQSEYSDTFGGPDAAHKNFTDKQKAINFAMTSFLTTGGIRGRKKTIEKFKPRSFNMGISKEVFEVTGGYRKIRVGEDLDLSIRIVESGFKSVFLPDAVVFHKRRSTWKEFYRQLSKFGMGRPILNKWYPETYSVFFLFPSLFTIGLLISLLLVVFKIYLFIGLYFLYFLLIFVSAAYLNKSLQVGFNSIIAVLIQFWGYGKGYLKSEYYLSFKGMDPREAFPELFFE